MSDTDGKPLKVGSFYWALPAHDPDADAEWINQDQNEADNRAYLEYGWSTE